MKALFKTMFLVTLAVLFSFMSLGTALAQSAPPTPVPLSSVRGVITAIGQTAVPPTVTIHPDKGPDVTLKIVATTKVTKASSGTAALVGVAVNDWAQATYNSSTMEAATLAVAPPPVRPTYLSGQIKSVGDGLFVLTVKDKGDLSIKVNDATKYKIPGQAEAKLSDLKAGDRVAVSFVETKEGNLALSVQLLPTYLSGQIKSVGDGLFVLTVKDKGDLSIKVNADTKYRIPGQAEAKLSDFKAGDRVSVSMWELKDGNLAASVQLLPVYVSGLIKSIEANKGFVLTVKDKGDVSIKVNDDTVYRIPGQDKPKLNDLEAGNRVSVSLIETKDGNLALSVQLLPISLAGQIKSIEAGKGFVLTVKDSSVSIKVNAETKYRIPGLAEAKLDDFKAGDRVSVSMWELKDGNLAASVQLLPVSLSGQIKSIEAGKGFVLTVMDKWDVAIKVNAETKYRIPGQAEAKLDDFKAGDRVSVSLMETKDGNLALSVQLLPYYLTGEIKSIEAQKSFVLTVMDRWDVSIKVNADTVYRIPDEHKDKLNDFKAGDRVSVSLIETKDGNLAISVQLLKEHDEKSKGNDDKTPGK